MSEQIYTRRIVSREWIVGIILISIILGIVSIVSLPPASPNQATLHRLCDAGRRGSETKRTFRCSTLGGNSGQGAHGQTSMPRDSVVTSMSAHHLLPSVMKLLPSVTEPTCSRGDSSCISNIINPTAVSIPYLWNYTPSGSSQRYQDLGDGGVYCWRCPGGTGMKPTVNRFGMWPRVQGLGGPLSYRTLGLKP